MTEGLILSDSRAVVRPRACLHGTSRIPQGLEIVAFVVELQKLGDPGLFRELP